MLVQVNEYIREDYSAAIVVSYSGFFVAWIYAPDCTLPYKQKCKYIYFRYLHFTQ